LALANDDENIEAQLAELRSHLEGLESGQLHIGNPHEGRTEAQMYDLRRKIAELEAILDSNAKQRD
jgi:hypothetical protein